MDGQNQYHSEELGKKVGGRVGTFVLIPPARMLGSCTPSSLVGGWPGRRPSHRSVVGTASLGCPASSGCAGRACFIPRGAPRHTLPLQGLLHRHRHTHTRTQRTARHTPHHTSPHLAKPIPPALQVDAEKRTLIKTLPHTLVLHLKRFEWDYETYQRWKVGPSFPLLPARSPQRPQQWPRPPAARKRRSVPPPPLLGPWERRLPRRPPSVRDLPFMAAAQLSPTKWEGFHIACRLLPARRSSLGPPPPPLAHPHTPPHPNPTLAHTQVKDRFEFPTQLDMYPYTVAGADEADGRVRLRAAACPCSRHRRACWTRCLACGGITPARPPGYGFRGPLAVPKTWRLACVWAWRRARTL